MKQLIQKSFFATFLLTTLHLSFAQKPDIIEPGTTILNTEILHTGSFLWENAGGLAFDKTGKPVERYVTINRTSKEIIIEERINDEGKDVIKRKTVLNTKTFEPIRANSETEEFTYNIQFGNKIMGEMENYKVGKNEKFDVPIEEKYFLESSLEFLVSILPLKVGYKAFIPVVSFDNGYRSKITRWEIKEVKEGKTFSCMSGGETDAFQVELVANALYSDTRVLLIDKNTRRIINSTILGSFKKTYFVDKEIHLNPIKTKFDASEAKAMISQGTSTITGQAYTIDENMPKAMTQSRRRVIAPKGSLVMLIPNTPYLKEWLEFNTRIRQANPPEYIAGVLYKGCHGYPLPLEVKQQSIVAEVTDKNGSFTFSSLKPGEYHIYVQFTATKYTSTSRTPNGDYEINIDPSGSGSISTKYNVTHWGSPTDVMNYKLVKIEKDGETVKVKLKN